MFSILDDRFDAARISAAAAAWPADDWPHWLRYDSPLERKRTCRDKEVMPRPVRLLLFDLLHLMIGVGAQPDPTLYGAGMHSMSTGDHLDVHLDADRHPHTGQQRLLNTILFLSPWEPNWGGELELWPPTLDVVYRAIEPLPGRLVVFDTDDNSYHGIPQPLTYPAGQQRMSLAVYWWGQPHGPVKRPRAQYVALAGEPFDPVKEQMRQERSRLL